PATTGIYTLSYTTLFRSAAIQARQKWVRETFWKLAGGMPERTPLHARTVGSFDREGYRVEKVLYETLPEFHVAANLYIPSSGKPDRKSTRLNSSHVSISY